MIGITIAGPSALSRGPLTDIAYEVVTKEPDYFGVYPVGGPHHSKSYLRWTRDGSGSTASGTLSVGLFSVLRRAGLGALEYKVHLAFSGSSVEMTISGHGANETVHGTLHKGGVLISFPAEGGVHVPLAIQFVAVPVEAHTTH